jgi:uncharacterized protein (TIGR03000 family)
MYSVVLMMALSGGSEAVDFGHKGGRGGCSGGGYATSGYGCTGGYGYGGYAPVSYGCTGSYGYVGSYGGYGCSGGYASGGCSGGRRHHGHHRRGGGGGCCGTVSYGSYGCYGGGYGYPVSYGCTGGYVGGYGAPMSYGCTGGYVGGSNVPAFSAPAPAAPSTTEPIPAPKEKKTSQLNAPATIYVSLPADAKLTVDGQSTTSTSSERVLVTPEIASGSQFVYTLRAEIVRDGQSLSLSRRVAVSAGETVEVPFAFAGTALVSR